MNEDCGIPGCSGGLPERTELSVPPWSTEEVASLNDYQASGVFHEFTCAGTHEGAVPLLATADGWVCSFGCDYTQYWAHAWMADGRWKTLGAKLV
jgi:hypothetical protein